MRNARDFMITVLVLALAGVAAGALWSFAAPRPPYVMTEQGPRLADPSTQALIAADGWFAVVTGVVGLACGAAGYSVSRRGRPLPTVVGLAAGGLLGAHLARLVGEAVNVGAVSVTASGPSASLMPGPLAVTAQGVLYAWPTLAVGLFFALEGITGYLDSPLRRPFGGADPYGPLSSYDISGR
ncbi:hypothetical protein FHS43_004183 [Streptosporangium becharense]|uniref:DUF2567 domain-containing protein n=1 Tax=Streptosporangium becharense TaxID=1816182 RepID=A0A7W9ICQ5_9ACTN|nr:hypothetical protein [Streptosporangium becharense]MBB2912888.1 hypothetical protein [Streptosporangium becharense]MBB5818287.1 hypothetical protein [Streptosporangium becharense]